MRSHPDFLCVGAQKAGTRWLYDQLRSHPGAWMPPIKELRFFGGREKLRDRVPRVEARLRRGGNPDPRDLEFLRRAAQLHAGSDLNDYVRLFEPAGELPTGDVTPAYHRLNAALIESVLRALPGAQYLYLLRDPVTRAWSQANMMVRSGKMKPEILADVDTLIQCIDKRPFVGHSYQSKDIKRWRGVVGAKLAIFTLEAISSRPDETRAAIFRHIGVGTTATLPAGYNRKTTEPAKTRLSAEARAKLVKHFAREYESLANMGFDYSSKQPIPTNLHHGPGSPKGA